MGFFSGWNNAHNAVHSVVAGGATKVANPFARLAGASVRGFNAVVNGTLHVAGSVGGTGTGIATGLMRPFRKLAIPAGIVAAIGLGGIAAMRIRGNRAAASKETLAHPEVEVPVMPQVALGGPADGRGSDEWQQRVRGAQGGMAVNPAMNVVPADSVQTVGR